MLKQSFTALQVDALADVAALAPRLFGMPMGSDRSVDQNDGVLPDRVWPVDMPEALLMIAQFATSQELSPKKLIMLVEGANTLASILEEAFPLAPGVPR